MTKTFKSAIELDINNKKYRSTGSLLDVANKMEAIRDEDIKPNEIIEVVRDLVDSTFYYGSYDEMTGEHVNDEFAAFQLMEWINEAILESDEYIKKLRKKTISKRNKINERINR